MRHADGRERLVDTRLAASSGEAQVERAEGDVLADGRHEQLVVRILEDEPDARTQLAERPVLDREAGDLELAFAGEQAVEVQDERRLAGAVRAEQGDALAVLDVEVDPGERRVAVRVAIDERRGWIAQLMPRPDPRRSGTSGGGPRRGRAVGAARREAAGVRHRAGVAAGEHREVDALAAAVAAQEERRRDPADAARLKSVPRPVPARRERGAHPLHLVHDHEQVAVHEGRDQASRRGTRSRSSPRRTSGKVVVAPSRTALTVPIVALTATVANVSGPPRTVSGPSPSRPALADERDERPRGGQAAARRGRGARRVRAHACDGRDRREHGAQATRRATPSGVETATTVSRRGRRIFARGSSRWIGLAGSPASPIRSGRSQSPLTPGRRAGLAAAGARARRAPASAKTSSVPTKPARPVATRSSSTHGNA